MDNTTGATTGTVITNGSTDEDMGVGTLASIISLSVLLLVALVGIAIQFYIKKTLNKKLDALEKKRKPTLQPIDVGTLLAPAPNESATSLASELMCSQRAQFEASQQSQRTDAERREREASEARQRSDASRASTPRRAAVVEKKEEDPLMVVPKLNQNELGMSSTSFVRTMKGVGVFLAEYHDHPEQYDVSTDVLPGFIYNALPTHPPNDPDTFQSIMNDYKKIVFPGLNHWQHPMFFGYFPCGRSFSDTIAEMVNCVLGVPTGPWDACPSMSELEVCMTNWVGRAIGLPETFLFQGNTETSPGGGAFTESASEAIFLAVLAARTRKIDQELREMGELVRQDEHYLHSDKTKQQMAKQHDICSKLVAYTSNESHSSSKKACQMAMVRCHAIETKPENEYAMRGAQLESLIKKDISAGLIPCMVHVTLGTTSSCAFDRLDEIVVVAEKYNIWVHIDSAYAGSFWVDPEMRKCARGIHQAHSVNANPHKVLLHSNSTSLIWTRDQKAFKAALKDYSDKTNRFTIDTFGWGVHDRKRSKALKVWFTFRMYGIDGLKAHCANMMEMCEYMRNLMVNHPNVRMFGARQAGLFSFQYVEENMPDDAVNYHTNRLYTYLNETRKMLISHSKVGESDILRVSIGYEKTCREDIDKAWEVMKQLIETYRDRKDDPSLLRFPPSPPKSFGIKEKGLKTPEKKSSAKDVSTMTSATKS